MIIASLIAAFISGFLLSIGLTRWVLSWGFEIPSGKQQIMDTLIPALWEKGWGDTITIPKVGTAMKVDPVRRMNFFDEQ